MVLKHRTITVLQGGVVEKRLRTTAVVNDIGLPHIRWNTTGLDDVEGKCVVFSFKRGFSCFLSPSATNFRLR